MKQLSDREIRQTVERVLIGEIEYLERTDCGAMRMLIAGLDGADRRAINVYLKRRNL